jgi:hypothetical protein
MQRLLLAVGVLAALAIAGCATAPTNIYGPSKTKTAIGYSVKPITLDQYFITFRAPRRAGQQAAEDYALLRAAEFTQEKGRTWFKLVSRDTAEVFIPRKPVVRSNTTQQNIKCDNHGGCSYEPSQNSVAGANVVVQGGSDAQIVCVLRIELGNGPKPEGSNVFDAKATAERLRASTAPAK